MVLVLLNFNGVGSCRFGLLYCASTYARSMKPAFEPAHLLGPDGFDGLVVSGRPSGDEGGRCVESLSNPLPAKELAIRKGESKWQKFNLQYLSRIFGDGVFEVQLVTNCNKSKHLSLFE